MKKLTALVLTVLIFGCSSSRLVDDYLDGNSQHFQAKKVLILGVTLDSVMQRQFEYSLQQALEVEGVVAIKSVDFFPTSFSGSNQTEEDLQHIENQLFNTDFDAVIFSKLTGQSSQLSIGQSYRNLSKSWESFRDHYGTNASVYSLEEVEEYPVYFTETSLYCVCPQRERDLIWRGKINIVNPSGSASVIRDYVKLIVKTLKSHNLLVGK